MRIFIKYLIIFTSFNLSINYAVSQDKLIVKLNLGDCHNCYNGLCYVEKMPETTATTIVLKESDRKIAGKFIKNTLGLKKQFSLIFSDSLYSALSTNSMSEIFAYQSDKIIYTSKLENYKGWPAKAEIVIDTLMKLSDSVTISKAIKITISKPFISIHDLVFNEVYLYDWIAQKQLLKIDKNTFSIDSIYSWVQVDSVSRTLFNKIRGQLRITQNDAFLISGCFFLDGDLRISGTFPQMRKSKGDTAMLTQRSILFHLINNDEQNKTFSLLNTFYEDNIKFFPSAGNVSPLSGNTVVVRSVSSNAIEPYRLDVWNMNSNIGEKGRQCLRNLPVYYIRTGLGDNLLNEIVRWPFLFFSLAPDVVNLETNQKLELPFNNQDFKFSFENYDQLKFNFELFDVFKKESSFLLLILKNNETFEVIEIDNKEMHVLKSTMLPKNITKHVVAYSFLDSTSIMGLTDDNMILKISF